jgi:DNA (cytosine-5)-methyltransferase 1
VRYLDTFSGIGSASVAWQPLGWQCVAHAEVSAFPSAVLKHRFPDTPNLGDCTRHGGWPDEPVELVCGGTPCQAFSVAGLRRGFADPRGNLTLTFLAIVDQYRPRWVVWENVAGILSHDGGRSLAAILGAMGQLGYGWCYRVLDAQYVRVDGFPHAVPQRRRRLFLVGHLGDWRPAAAVLSERQGLQGHSPPRRKAGQGVANSLVDRPDRGGGNSEGQRLIPDVCGTLSDGAHMGGGPNGQDAHSGRVIPLVASPISANEANTYSHAGNNSGAVHNVVPVAFSAKDHGGVMPAIASQYAVRRLLPVECERLQGLPDGWTDVPWRGKDHAPDGPRYKAIGNGWAVNTARWVGTRIAEVEAWITETGGYR